MGRWANGLVLATIIALLGSGGTALAQVRRTVPLPHVRASVAEPANAWHTARPGAHVIYGTILSVKAGLLTVRLRNVRAVAVDARAAIANGDYSAPLFVGKIVCVDGNVVGSTFAATHVYRMSNLADLPADR